MQSTLSHLSGYSDHPVAQNHRKKIILLQPRCGKYDLYICDLPISLIYVASVLQSKKYDVVIIDQRVQKDWKTRLLTELRTDPLLVGITVMTGEPIKYALKLSQIIKNVCDVPVVWGGIHPTILPEQTIQNDNIDFVVRGKGEYALFHLAHALENGGSTNNIPGLVFKDKSGLIYSNETDTFDWTNLPAPPYHLVDHAQYFRSGFGNKVISIMTSRNCPHRCTFCYNSSLATTEKWISEPIERTQAILIMLVEKYRPNYISFIDDDFFVVPERAKSILNFLIQKKWDISIGFRGARVDELMRLDDSVLGLLVKANTRHINIGVESGSETILKRLVKRITPEMVLALNRRLSKYESLIPLYNFFSGIPGETEEDIRKSTELILRLIDDNPQCQISGYHQYTPYPGSALYEEAIHHGFREPTTLETWNQMRLETNSKNCPWIDRRRRRLLNTIYTCVYFVDRKYEVYFLNQGIVQKVLYPLVRLYRPFARFRLKHLFSTFPLEIYLKDFFYFIAEIKTRLFGLRT
ncbi:MAG: B12-binding domain-containing radical SAM protein [Deltaproteobacteria bacterium]|nr:B12-binding domain-containing radical SAM protein [Deltaproteobacteria bacterium]